MPLLLGKLSDFVHESEGLSKVGERERSRDVMPVYDFPLRNLAGKVFEFLPGERRSSPTAWDTGFAGKLSHGVEPPRTVVKIELYRNTPNES
jgi:hypothetical protein